MLFWYKISFADEIRTLPVDTFENLQELRFLSMHNNFLMDITALAKAKSLKKLFLSKNQIHDATPLHSLEKLETLDLGDNHVKDIMPLLRLPALKKLHIPNNQITELQPIGQVNQLEELNLRQNKIKHLPLDFLLSLSIPAYCEVYLGGNPIQNISSKDLSVHKDASSLIRILEKQIT